jgi:hypothetical protein
MQSAPPAEAHTSMPAEQPEMPNTTMPQGQVQGHGAPVAPAAKGQRGSIVGVARELGNAVIASMASQCIPVILCASLALMIQASQNCGDINEGGNFYVQGGGIYAPYRGGTSGSPCARAWDGMLAYGVAVGALSVVVCVVCLLMNKFKPGSLVAVEVYIAFFLALWWSLGAGILTFDAPYTNVSNGYFACWVGAISSNIYLFMSSRAMRDANSNIKVAAEQQPAFLLLLASTVEMIAAANVCANSHYCEEEHGWAVAVGCLSMLTCLIVIVCAFAKITLPRLIMQVIAIFLVVLWIPGVYVVTFIAPFQTVGNGYLAAWSALFLSIIFAENVFLVHPMQQQPADGGASQQTDNYDAAAATRDQGARAGSVETL